MSSNELTAWLADHDALIVSAVSQRAPNLLIDVDELADFLHLVRQTYGASSSAQLSAVQSWAHQCIGDDAQLAGDWLTALRLVRDTMAGWLARDFTDEAAFAYWRMLDRFVTVALIEAARLSGGSDHSTMLAYMEELKAQVAALEQSKTSFLTVAAHELRTPLTILEGYANMLRGGLAPDDRQTRLLLDGMGNGIRRLKEIIGDMIDVTMIDAHALSISFQPLYLDKIVRMAAESLSGAFRERQVLLEVFSMPVTDAIYADPSRLFQAVTRLLSNSLKFTPDGGRVTVTGHRTRMDEAAGDIAGYVEIRVADTGIGIPADQLDSIFEKFGGARDVALHSSGRTKFKGGGPGLGLPIVRGIVEAHGGRVWAESPGWDEESCPGSVFHLELPVRLRPPAE